MRAVDLCARICLRLAASSGATGGDPAPATVFHDLPCVCGLDCQLFVNLLPAWFPHGLLLLHCEGALLHFRSGFPPASVLPEVAWLH